MPEKTAPTPVIIARRTAAAVLNQFCAHTLGMGTMAEKFHGDYDEEWAVIDVREIKALKHNELVATVTFGSNGATLSIPEPSRLAQRKHRSEFRPKDFGFQQRAMNWRKEMEPYLIVEAVPDSIPGLHAPVYARRRGLQAGKPGVRRSV